MNELMDKYSKEGLVVLGFPCNQFAFQENCKNEEILYSLKYVRPGNGFLPKIELFSKIDVNGKNCHPLFTFLKKELPTPHDDPVLFIGDPKYIVWSPVTRSDVAWNFEKFLIDSKGKPFRRYSRRYQTSDLSTDIEALLTGK